MTTQKNLSELFEQARRAQAEVPVSDVKSLLESGKSSPLAAKPSFRPRRITRLFNPLKLIVMITTLVIITSALILNFGNLDKTRTNEVKVPEGDSVESEQTASKQTVNRLSIVSDSITDKASGSIHNPDKPAGSEQVSGQSIPSPKQSGIKRPGTMALYGNIEPTSSVLLLGQEVLSCLGYGKTDAGYEFPTRTKSGLTSFSFFPGDLKHRGYGTAPCTLTNLPDESMIIIGITTGIGKVELSAKAFEGIPLWISGNTQALLELCIPVKFDDPVFDSLFWNPLIWVYPNEKFFTCLPPDISRQMRMEFNYQLKRLDPNFVPQMGGSIGIGGGQAAKDTVRMGGSIGLKGGGLQKDSGDFSGEPVPCVYFTNLCETLSGLEYVNLYPNPATSQINVDLVLQKAKKIRFRVFDLGGKLISGEETPQHYPDRGRVTHSVDISKLGQGFYLMVMTDEEGSRVTRRFVKN